MKTVRFLTKKSVSACLWLACMLVLVSLSAVTACSSTSEPAGCILQSSCSLDKQEYMQGEIVNISITNALDRDIQLNEPLVLVYRLEEGGNGSDWVEVGMVRCPCGAMCDMVSFVIIEPGETVEYEWDQMEEWCGEAGSTEKFSEQVQPGQYKIMLPFEDCDCYLEFTIEE